MNGNCPQDRPIRNHDPFDGGKEPELPPLPFHHVWWDKVGEMQKDGSESFLNRNSIARAISEDMEVSEDEVLTLYTKNRVSIQYEGRLRRKTVTASQTKHWKPTDIEVFILVQLATHGRNSVERSLECSNKEFSSWASQTRERRFEVNRALKAFEGQKPAYLQRIERKARQWMGEMRGSGSTAKRVYDRHYLDEHIQRTSA